MKRKRVILGGFALIAAVGLIMLNAATGILFAAPQVDLAALVTIHPSVRIQINTSPIARQILDAAHESGRVPLAGLLVPAFLPHGASLWLAPNYERDMIEVRALLQERRAGPLVARLFNHEGMTAGIEQIAFDQMGAMAPCRGAVTLAGWLPLEKNAGDDLFKSFNQNPTPDLRPMEGGHLVEVRADNRNGGAYLVFASLLYAYDIDLDEQEEQISLTSFQFVEQIALTADVVLGDSVGFVCEMDVESGKKDKIAIVNLKVGLEELLQRIGKNVNKNHGLTLTGETEWRGDTLVFTYRLDDVPRLLKTIRKYE